MIRIKRVTGNSMEPSLKAGDYVLVLTKFFKPKPNDIVIARVDNKEVIKRVRKKIRENYWIEGDNKESSVDYVIEKELVSGKVLFTISRSSQYQQ